MRLVINKLVAKFRELGRLTPLALVTTFLPVLGSSVLLAVGYPLGNWMRANWEIGSIAFLLGAFFFCGLALLPTNLIGILAGWAFGFPFGLVLLISAVVGSATVGYLVNRRLTGETLTGLAERNARTNAILKALTNEGFFKTVAVITLIRMSVIMPFAFTNFFLAAARVPISSFVIGTFLGMLPRSGAMALVGAGLSVLTFDGFDDFWFLAAGVPATLVLVILVGVISRRALDRLTLEGPSPKVHIELQ